MSGVPLEPASGFTSISPHSADEIQSVSCLALRPGTVAIALRAIEHWLLGETAALRGCFYSRFGARDRILLWHSFENHIEFDSAMLILSGSSDPYGAGHHLESVSTNAFRTVPFAGPLPAGPCGPLFEVRDYVTRPDGLRNLLDLWRPVLPARLEIAPWVTAMYALSGTTPRLLHIYPWASLEERAHVREAAQKVGWPAPGSAAHILDQETTVYLAASFSPLQ